MAGGGSTEIQVPSGSKICDDSSGCLGNDPFEACAAGSFGLVPPENRCLDCLAGFSSSRGATSCHECDKGKFTDVAGSLCKECSPGTFQDQNTDPSLFCKKCPSGWKQDRSGSSSCADLGGIKPKDCQSSEYFDPTLIVRNETPPGGCRDCPTGGSCIGPINVTGIRSKFGWSRCPLLHFSSAPNFTKCTFPAACQGASNALLEGKYFSEKSNEDLAMLNAVESCSTGYQKYLNNDSRFNLRCSTCAPNFAAVESGV